VGEENHVKKSEMGEPCNTHGNYEKYVQNSKTLVEKPGGKRQLGTFWCRWGDS
jgi:hypothetical protein